VDGVNADGFLMAFIHTVDKDITILLNHQIIHHFSTTLSLFYARLSQTHAEYPRNLAEQLILDTFAVEIV